MEKALLYFSGGKDSTALMYFMGDLLQYIDVAFCDTGVILPEIRDHIENTCKKLDVDLIVVRPDEDIREFQAREGLPSDIVPIEQTHLYAQIMNVKVDNPIQSYMSCCSRMLWEPMEKFVRGNGYNTVIRGSKRCDTRVGVPDGHIHDGVTYLSPLWDWSHEDVFEFLREQNVALPRHYRFFADSLDCYICTGHLKHFGGERIKYIREYHPDLYPELFDRLAKVDKTVHDEWYDVERAIEEGIR